MIFCEDCRIKKNWPQSPGFPFVGHEYGMCEVCKRSKNCHSVPSLLLIPDSERTTEQKQLYGYMQDGFRDKAENLVVVHVSGKAAGKLNHDKTELIRKIIAKNKSTGEIDWYTTYQLRLVAQQGYQRDEESKRNRRSYGI